MSYIVTQQDLDLLRQSVQEVHVKIELCNKSLRTLDSLEGTVISDGYTQVNGALQRRTFQCDFYVANTNFLIGYDKNIWVNKRLRVYYGVRSLRTQEIIWYLIGTFVYVDINFTYNSTNHTVSVTCADLMAEYDGTLNGRFRGYEVSHGIKILAGEDIRKSIVLTLEDAGIDKYLIEDIGKEVPYDLEFSHGATYADVWKQICELYDSWEFFFDTDGTFIWRKVSTCLEDPVVLNHSILKDLIIDEAISTSFSNIYNVTEVWGKVLELENDDRYSETSSWSNNTYRVDFSDYSSWDDIDHLTKIAFKTSNENQDSPRFSINGYSSIPIYDGDGVPLKAGALSADTVYVFRYRRLGVNENGIESALYLLGQYQCYGKYVETSKDCPFSVPNLGYEIRQSFDYDSLSDDTACYNQAEYLTYTTTAMMDTVTLTLPVIPWLEVNTKVEYIPVNSNTTNKANQYIIKDISWSSGNGTMKVVLYRFLESFSYVYKNKYR